MDFHRQFDQLKALAAQLRGADRDSADFAPLVRDFELQLLLFDREARSVLSSPSQERAVAARRAAASIPIFVNAFSRALHERRGGSATATATAAAAAPSDVPAPAAAAAKSSAWTPPDTFIRKTEKFVVLSDAYVLPICLLAVKNGLPSLELGVPTLSLDSVQTLDAVPLPGDPALPPALETTRHRRISSFYFDDGNLRSYHKRLQRRDGASVVRLRYYGDSEDGAAGQRQQDPELPLPPNGGSTVCFFEIKTHREDAESSKERFPILLGHVDLFVAQRLSPSDVVDAALAEMTRSVSPASSSSASASASASESAAAAAARRNALVALATTIQQHLTRSSAARPVLRTTYTRIALQSSSNNDVRFSLDTDVVLTNITRRDLGATLSTPAPAVPAAAAVRPPAASNSNSRSKTAKKQTPGAAPAAASAAAVAPSSRNNRGKAGTAAAAAVATASKGTAPANKNNSTNRGGNNRSAGSASNGSSSRTNLRRIVDSVPASQLSLLNLAQQRKRPDSAAASSATYRFPFPVLEVKTARDRARLHALGAEEWLERLLAAGWLMRVERLSKYGYGVSQLRKQQVGALPEFLPTLKSLVKAPAAVQSVPAVAFMMQQQPEASTNLLLSVVEKPPKERCGKASARGADGSSFSVAALLAAVLPASITGWLVALLLLLLFMLVALMFQPPQVLHPLLEYIATLQASSLPF